MTAPFLIGEWGLYWMSWEDAYTFRDIYRIKSSLAMTRARIRRAMCHTIRCRR